jgi:hypothetical protein
MVAKNSLVIEFFDEAQDYIENEAARTRTTNAEVARKMLNFFIAANKPEIEVLFHNRETNETKQMLRSSPSKPQ